MGGEAPAAWLQAIDATYTLFEDPDVRAQYPALGAKVEAAVRACEGAVREFGCVRESTADARLPHCALSFNGGKDCTVLAHVLAAVARRLAGARGDGIPRMHALYVACESPFPAVEQFIGYACSPVTGYNLALDTAHAPMRDALASFLRRSDADGGVPRPDAIFIGVRRDDPHGASIGVRSQSDPGWPPILRVHPILTWDYADVWAFLRCPLLSQARYSDGAAAERPPYVSQGDVGVPYCALYDEGYTSLSSTDNTKRNPYLRLPDSDEFLPAYKLQDGVTERAGRV
ncbi:FAD synthase [Malassezia sp. CBS 17886]|nr:FAD synthase [Malassezia sp. CBS 17886]